MVLYLQLHYNTEKAFCLLRVCYKSRFACKTTFAFCLLRALYIVRAYDICGRDIHDWLNTSAARLIYALRRPLSGRVYIYVYIKEGFCKKVFLRFKILTYFKSKNGRYIFECLVLIIQILATLVYIACICEVARPFSMQINCMGLDNVFLILYNTLCSSK